MSVAARTSLAVLIGLVLGAVVHIAIILALPWAADGAAFAQFVPDNGDTVELTMASGSGTSEAGGVHADDPAVATSICAFDLTAGPVRVVSPVAGMVQSISIHSRRGGVLYALSDRAATRGSLSMVLLTQQQLDAVLAEETTDGSQELRIALPVTSGYVVTRVVAPVPSLIEQARQVAMTTQCRRT